MKSLQKFSKGQNSANIWWTVTLNNTCCATSWSNYKPSFSLIGFFFFFFCVKLLRPSQPNGVMSSAVSLPNHKFTGQA